MTRSLETFLKKNHARRKAINAVEVTIDVILLKLKNHRSLHNLIDISITYSHPLKFNPIGKEIAPTIAMDSVALKEERD